jgi:hypothetical protein
MRSGLLSGTREKKSYPETDESGQFWRSTLLDSDSRLRVACGIGKDETQASGAVFRKLQQREHADTPPPLISDGWGGIDEAMVEVYGVKVNRPIVLSHKNQFSLWIGGFQSSIVADQSPAVKSLALPAEELSRHHIQTGRNPLTAIHPQPLIGVRLITPLDRIPLSHRWAAIVGQLIFIIEAQTVPALRPPVPEWPEALPTSRCIRGRESGCTSVLVYIGFGADGKSGRPPVGSNPEANLPAGAGLPATIGCGSDHTAGANGAQFPGVQLRRIPDRYIGMLREKSGLPPLTRLNLQAFQSFVQIAVPSCIPCFYPGA